jgi:hypothetical protein
MLQIAWGLLFVHGLRRLYESLALVKGKGSKSKMPFVAYAVAGIGFYVFVGVAVWVESIRELRHFLCSIQFLDCCLKITWELRQSSD